MKNNARHLKTIYLEATREEERLKIGVHRPDDVIWSYEDISAPMENIETRCREMVEALNRAGRENNGDPDVVEKVKEVGRILCDELLTPSIKKTIKKTDALYLILNLDDHLVHIPWELLCMGEQFLCQHFNMGRLVKTRQKAADNGDRKIARPLKMWVLANPEGDLAGADSEAFQICRYIDEINAEGTFVDAFIDSEISADIIKEKIRNYDFVHFAGHAYYNEQNQGESGWQLLNGNLTAGDIQKMVGGAVMPALVFSNACQSARTEVWEDKQNVEGESFGLANAFMLAGVRHYVGTIWEITDEPSSRFSLEFYKHLLSGRTVGEAVRLARLAVEQYAPANACWASYVLYGDPTSTYFAQEDAVDVSTQSRPIELPPGKTATRGKGAGVSWNAGKLGEKQNWWAVCLVLMGLLFGIVLAFYAFQGHGPIKQGQILELITRLEKSHGVSPEALAIIQEQERLKQARIDQLFKELEKITSSSAPGTPAERPTDDWTSTPLTMAVFCDSKTNFLNKEKDKLVTSIIEEQLIKNTRATLLERMSLDRILEELKRANSQLIAPQNRLVPELLSAKLILTLEVIQYDSGAFVLMHLADTQKARVVDIFVEPLQIKQSVLSQKARLSKKLLEKLKANYPLRARILRVTDKNCELNIGYNAGVKIGQRFRAPEKDLILEIESVKAHTSMAEVRGSAMTPEIGWKVERIVD
ncbi:MAG: CHAT domain-containing protein [Desulfobacterales bacterium]|nr:CHAT domain-containing protein [Desulfobacterales bacterium]